MQKKRYIFGNWKMNGTPAMARELTRFLVADMPSIMVQVALFPPFPFISQAAQTAQGSALAIGGQDCSKHTAPGAFTGEVSATMLKDIGCRYVLVGHSERRTHHAETDATVKVKAEAALAAGLIPVICVGESETERMAGTHLATVESQMRASLPSLNSNESINIAYEPVWAIGSGAVPTAQQIEEMHKTIASLLTYDTSGAQTAILYGGSVKGSNAKEILSIPGVDGVLVGGASLKIDEFSAIILSA